MGKHLRKLIAALFACTLITSLLPATALAAESKGVTSTDEKYTVVFEGDTLRLTSDINGGTWSSSKPDVATVSSSGVVTARNAGDADRATVAITHQGNWGQREVFNVLVLPKTVEAKVYLLYENEVPDTINQGFNAAGFGPAGDNTSYIEVTLDLQSMVEDNTLHPYVNSSGYVFFSIDNAGPSGDRASAAESYWETNIKANIDPDDAAALDAIFPGNSFIGYVAKAESNGWHIDGVLTEDPPVYVVELYDGGRCVFALNDGDSDEGVPGVTHTAFNEKLEAYLGGTDYRFSYKENELTVDYFKDGKAYRATITPRSAPSDSGSGILADEGFSYHTVTNGIYYVCRLVIENEVVPQYGSLALSKLVEGNAANVDTHFTFELSCTSLAGNQFTAVYEGVGGCSQNHPGTVSFDGSGKAVVALKHGERVAISGIPESSSVSVAETGLSGDAYTDVRATVSVDGGEPQEREVTTSDGLKSANIGEAAISANSTTSFEVTNKAVVAPASAYNLDVAPFAGLLAAGVAGLGVFAVARRRSAAGAWKE